MPPAVRFLWGSFQFDGIMESLEETLEFFSPEGRPLRASITLTLSQQQITEFAFRDAGGRAPVAGAVAAGTQPLTQAPSRRDAAGAGRRAGQRATTGRRSPRPTASRTRCGSRRAS